MSDVTFYFLLDTYLLERCVGCRYLRVLTFCERSSLVNRSLGLRMMKLVVRVLYLVLRDLT